MADMDLIAPGEVWLVGAGPGDPDLLTRKAERLIQAASIVFHDALVGPGVMALVPSHVRRVAVGKRSGRHSKDQGAINALLVEAALDGERVVRLKGGDPSIFGRSAEEMAALRAHGVRVSICPGITAASAAVAHAGASLTLRGLARRLTFMTAHVRDGVVTGIDWRALADPDATLAIYMGRSAAGEIAAALAAGGLAADTPVLVAANVSLASEVLVRTRLDLMSLAVSTMPAEAPAVLIVGAAVAQADQSRRATAARPARRSYI